MPERKLAEGQATQGLIARYDAIRAEEAASLDDARISGIVEGVLATMRGGLTGPEAALLAEVEELGRTISAAKQEIAALQVDDINRSFIPSATDELDAIVAATAGATNEILDACETLEGLAGVVGAEQAAALQGATTRIYEACSFQDITGQRITKVVSTLKTIETRVAKILQAFGRDGEAQTPPASTAAPTPAVADETKLLNGPQLPGNANDQAEIDRLLASFD